MRNLFLLALLLTLAGCATDSGYNPPPDDPFPPNNGPIYGPPPYIPPVPLPPVHKHNTDSNGQTQ